ncbi:F-box domain protein [Oesophagostomum dentatum]|uniref:F-box domain protein n=1 Tax=Oesophagostomum dentatum TaxID=61180 RepID=A0A0B1SHK1_OESDE|nr:F-box domain protein [Oesophagostomum dentatum]
MFRFISQPPLIVYCTASVCEGQRNQWSRGCPVWFRSICHSLLAATGITLIHLLSLGCVREEILRNMEPRSVVRLSGVSRLLRSILHSPSVDRTYWMQRLSSDFGTTKVQQAQRAGRRFRNVYAEEYAARKLAQRQNPLLLESPFNPLPRGGGGQPNAPFLPGPRGPYAPYPPEHPRAPDPPRHPDPLFPAPDPLQPIPDPNPLAVPPRINPHRPGAPFNPDPFDPFDPDNREIFPGRPNQGIPRGGPRYFPANRWDRGNDYI